jgi:hypothetical protein
MFVPDVQWHSLELMQPSHPYFQAPPAHSFHEKLVFPSFSSYIRFTMSNVLFYTIVGGAALGVLFIVVLFWVMTKYFGYDWRRLLSYITLIDPHPRRPRRPSPPPAVISRSSIHPSHNNDVEADAASVRSHLTITPSRLQQSRSANNDAESDCSVHTIRPLPRAVTRHEVIRIPPVPTTPPPAPPITRRTSSDSLRQYDDLFTRFILSAASHRTLLYEPHANSRLRLPSSTSSLGAGPQAEVELSSRFSMD